MYQESDHIRRAVIYWFITAGYMGLLFYLSSSLAPSMPKLPRNFDKIIHMFAYIPLAFLFYRSLRASGMRKYVFVLAVFFAGLYGSTDELHQYFVPGRDADIFDILADCTGAFLGSTGASLFRT